MDGAEVEGGGDMGWCKAERGGRGEERGATAGRVSGGGVRGEWQGAGQT